jgi:hypothetical protein
MITCKDLNIELCSSRHYDNDDNYCLIPGWLDHFKLMNKSMIINEYINRHKIFADNIYIHRWYYAALNHFDPKLFQDLNKLKILLR